MVELHFHLDVVILFVSILFQVEIPSAKNKAYFTQVIES